MLVKSYIKIKSFVYKRHKTPNYPNLICQVYNCREGKSHKLGSKICDECDKINEKIEKLYNDAWDWDTCFCYTYEYEKRKA